MRTDEDDMTIGAAAEMVGCSIKAIRDYDRLGLIATQRSKGGLRRLDTAAFARLEFILEMKAYLFTLKEIKELLSDQTIAETLRLPRSLAEKRLPLVVKERNRLNKAIATLRADLKDTE